MSEPIYQRVMDDLAGLFHPHRYDDPDSPAAAAPEAPVIDLATIEQDVRTRIEEVVAKGREVLDEVLPKVAQAAADAQADPLVQAIEAIVDPEARTLLTSLANKLGTVAAAVQVTAPAAAVDPAMGEPAGPQVSGVA